MSAVPRLGIFFIAILFLFHPAPIRAQDTFFDAYVRGIELEKARNWGAAREAFLQAVAQHPEPGRRPKARGPNFTRVYDPYVRLARCEVRLGMLDEAARHLQVSRSAGVTPQQVLDDVEREIRRHKSANAPPGAGSSAAAGRF